MNLLRTFAGALGVLALGWASNAGAVTLQNTGVADWQLVAAPSGVTTGVSAQILSQPAGYTSGTWYTAPSGSNWITAPGYVDANGYATGNAPQGDYTYRLDFSDPLGDVTISWATDNSGIFYLNGAELLPHSLGFGSLSSLTIAAGQFQTGNNYIEVVVTNAPGSSNGNPTGLLLTAEISPVPLPAAFPLFLSGVAGVGAVGAWRKRRQRVSRPSLA